VALVLEAFEERRGLHQGVAQLVLGDARGGGLLDDEVAVDAAEAQLGGELLGDHLTPAHRAAGDRHNRHSAPLYPLTACSRRSRLAMPAGGAPG
jgi:hypothetical protein